MKLSNHYRNFLISLFALLLGVSCGKTRLVYYSPNLVKPIASSEVITTPQPNSLTQETKPTPQKQSNQILFAKASAPNQLRVSTAAVKVWKQEVVNHIGEKIVKAHPKLAKVSYNRFGRLYLGLGMMALAALLILILVNIPSLSGDDGCMIFAMLLMLAGVGLITAISGLIFGLLN